jgi:alkanesulfonate monooxygenase
MARPPQGYPVFAQASGSDRGLDVAAQIAEIVFSPLHGLEKAQAFYRDLKDRTVRHGRSADAIKLMPGLNPIVGHTEAEARDKQDYLTSLIHDDVGRTMLSTALAGLDLSGCAADRSLPEEICEAALQSGRSEARLVVAWSREGLTLRQIYQRYAGARGQASIVGTASQIVDHMELWFRAHAVDGFLIQPPVLPLDLDLFVELVIPELQNRGLFRTEYEGATLRENLGLARPTSRYRLP